jgi:hypothetical protein
LSLTSEQKELRQLEKDVIEGKAKLIPFDETED